jgi:hypothetical protein
MSIGAKEPFTMSDRRQGHRNRRLTLLVCWACGRTGHFAITAVQRGGKRIFVGPCCDDPHG